MNKTLKLALMGSVAAIGLSAQTQIAAAGDSHWEGLYVGAGVSGNIMTSDQRSNFHTDEDFDTAGVSSSESSEFDLNLLDELWDSDAVVTLEAGHNWQLDNNWVAGIGVDYQFGSLESGAAGEEVCGYYMDVNEADSSGSCTGFEHGAEIEDSWSVIGRVGKLVHPYVLVYGLAGATWSDIRVGMEGAICQDGSVGDNCLDWDDGAYPVRQRFTRSSNETGLTIGGGVELWLSGPWSGKMEYRYTDYDDINANFAVEDECGDRGGATGCTGSTRFDADVHSVRLVITRKLDLSGMGN